jgi:uncharacterized protein YggE
MRAAILAFFSKHPSHSNKILHESLSINPTYSYPNNVQQVDGYVASTSFSIQTDSIDDTGSLVDDLTSAEATLSGIKMTLKVHKYSKKKFFVLLRIFRMMTSATRLMKHAVLL